MSLMDDVNEYETWLRPRCAVVEKGLRKKHQRMADNAFEFFRATCFRFARTVADLVPDARGAPRVPSVGDAHIENWGTWRDAEGRLVWGVNDFDEAAVLPCTYDLLRLATSTRLAPGLPGTNKERTASILEGYRRGLRKPGPLFVDDEIPWMNTLVHQPATRQGAFRAELDAIEPAQPPPGLAGPLRALLPPETHDIHFGARQRGVGSLGRPRHVAMGVWRGGLVAREAKAQIPSAWDWALGVKGDEGLLLSMATGRFRAPDPFLTSRAGFLCRRLAPDSVKIDLAGEEALAYGPLLLAAMGADLAAIHVAGGVDAETILGDLRGRPDTWLHEAAKTVGDAVKTDFQTWRAFQAGLDARTPERGKGLA